MEPSIRGDVRGVSAFRETSLRVFARQKHFSCASRRTPRSRSRRFLRFGSRSVVTPGVRARGWGGTRTSSRTRPPSAEPPSWRPSCSSRGCAGWAVSGSKGERPENGQRVGKSGESVRGDAPGAAEAGFWSASGERDMLAMSVKLAGRGARVHVRRVSRARATRECAWVVTRAIFSGRIGFRLFAFRFSPLARVFRTLPHSSARVAAGMAAPAPPRMASPTRATSRSTWTK